MRMNTHLVWRAFPFLRYSILLIFGFLLYKCHAFSSVFYGISFSITFIAFLFLHSISQTKPSLIKSILFSLIWVLLACLIVAVQTESSLESNGRIDGLVYGNIIEFRGPKDKTDHYRLKLRGRKQNDVWVRDERVLDFYFTKNEEKFKKGDLILTELRSWESDNFAIGNKESWRQIQKMNGVDGNAYAPFAQIIGHEVLSFFQSWISTLKAYTYAQFDKHIHHDNENALAIALFTGDRSRLEDQVSQNFRAAGIYHILALSGLHIGILFLLFNFFLKSGKGRWVQAIILLGFLWLFAAFTGFSTSVSRSVLMFSVYLLARTWGRDPLPIHVVSLSAFLLLIYDAEKLYDVGFQLSFAAVWGIILWSPAAFARIKKFPSPLRIPMQWILISLIAQLATAPLTLYYFNTFPVYFLPANFITVPLMPLILSGLIISLLNIPYLVEPVSLVTEYLLSWLLGVGDYFSDLDSSIYSLKLDNIEVAVLYGLIFVLLNISFKRINYKLILISVFFLIQFIKEIKQDLASTMLITRYKGSAVIMKITSNTNEESFCWTRSPDIDFSTLNLKNEIRVFQKDTIISHNGLNYLLVQGVSEDRAIPYAVRKDIDVIISQLRDGKDHGISLKMEIGANQKRKIRLTETLYLP